MAKISEPIATQINPSVQIEAKPTRRDLTTTYGVNGEMFISTFYNEENKVDDLNLVDYRKMKDTDGQVQMLLNATVNTILSSGYTIVEDPDFVPTEANPVSEEKLFIEKNLFAPKWKGGMLDGIDLVNRNFMRALEEGFRVYEVVYRVEDGKYVLHRIAPRAAATNRDSDLKLIVDRSGDYVGFHQKSSFASQTVDIIVVNDSEIHKTINVVWGREYGSNYGRSALKPVWYHYNKAHKGMYLNHIGHELGAVKFRHLKKKGGGTNEQDAEMHELLAKIGLTSFISYNENFYELTFEDVSDADVMRVGKEMIDFHVSQMAKAWLTQFIDLGTTNSGNRALGESQVDFFKSGLSSISQILIEDTWNMIIADLIRLNFDRGIYPTLSVNPIEDESAANLFKALDQIIKSGKIPSKLRDEVILKASKDMNLDVTQEDLQEEPEEMEVDSIDSTNQLETDNAEEIEEESATIDNSEIRLEEIAQTPRRELYESEERVRFGDINSKLRSLEGRAAFSLEQKMQEQKQAIISQFVEASRTSTKNIAKVKVQLQETPTQYEDELIVIALEALEFGKVMAANELQVTVPTTTKTDRSYVESEVVRIIDKQSADLKFRLGNVATTALLGNVAENVLQLLLEQEFTNFVTSVVPSTLSALIPTNFNFGRGITFKKNQAMIFGYRYTAVLDSSTTQYCRDMDGRVFQQADPNYYLVTPPNHFGCRSFWTAITKEQANNRNIQVDGKPEDLPVFSSISTFRDVPTL